MHRISLSKRNYSKMKNNIWSKIIWHMINTVIKMKYKLLCFFIDVEDSKEYEPGDLWTHNRKMLSDNRYVFRYHFKRMMYKIRFAFLNFIVDIIVTIFVFIVLGITMTISSIITYIAFLILLT